MKKTYNAPELLFEEYELSTSIAGNCGNKLYQDAIRAGSWTTCSVDMGDGDFLFVNGKNDCNMDPYEDATICYENFATDKMLFNS